MSALDGLLGKVLTDDVEIELSEGLNFKNGMVATLNPVTNLTEVSFGAGVDHGDMQIADGIHGTFWKTFINSTDRHAFTASLSALHVGRRALQLSDATVWDVLPVPGSSPQTYGWGLSCAGLEADVSSPVTIITSGGALNAWYRGDTVVQSGGFVSQWTDKIGNSLNHLVQATGANQPAFTATDSTLNNQPTILGDGVNDYLHAPSATVGAVYWIGAVIKQVTWSSAARLIQSGTSAASRAALIQGGGTPNLEQFEVGIGGNGPSAGAAIGAWKYVEWASNNTTSDFLHVGSDVQTGVASGRTASSTEFFAFSDGAHLASCAIAEIIVANYIPTLTERNNIKAYVAARYIASLIT